MLVSIEEFEKAPFKVESEFIEEELLGAVRNCFVPCTSCMGCPLNGKCNDINIVDVYKQISSMSSFPKEFRLKDATSLISASKLLMEGTDF